MRAKIYPANDAEQQQALDVDEYQTGWPRMALEMMLDVAAAAIDQIDGTNQFSCRATGS